MWPGCVEVHIWEGVCNLMTAFLTGGFRTAEKRTICLSLHRCHWIWREPASVCLQTSLFCQQFIVTQLVATVCLTERLTSDIRKQHLWCKAQLWSPLLFHLQRSLLTLGVCSKALTFPEQLVLRGAYGLWSVPSNALHRSALSMNRQCKRNMVCPLSKGLFFPFFFSRIVHECTFYGSFPVLVTSTLERWAQKCY